MKQRKSWLWTSGLTRNRPLPQLWSSFEASYIRQFRDEMQCCASGADGLFASVGRLESALCSQTPEDALDDRFVEACQMHAAYRIYGRCADGGDLGRTGIGGRVELMAVGRQNCFSARVYRTKEKEVAHHGEPKKPKRLI